MDSRPAANQIAVDDYYVRCIYKRNPAIEPIRKSPVGQQAAAAAHLKHKLVFCYCCPHLITAIAYVQCDPVAKQPATHSSSFKVTLCQKMIHLPLLVITVIDKFITFCHEIDQFLEGSHSLSAFKWLFLNISKSLTD